MRCLMETIDFAKFGVSFSFLIRWNKMLLNIRKHKQHWTYTYSIFFYREAIHLSVLMLYISVTFFLDSKWIRLLLDFYVKIRLLLTTCIGFLKVVSEKGEKCKRTAMKCTGKCIYLVKITMRGNQDRNFSF